MPNIVLPHWLNATKLWKHSKTTSFLLKCAPLPAFLSQYQAIVRSGLAMRPLAMSSSRSLIQLLREFEQRADRHVVVVDDRLRRIAEGEDGIEALADRAHLRRNRIALHPEVQIPINIPVVVEIMPHEGLAGEFRVEQLVEECDGLALYIGW